MFNFREFGLEDYLLEVPHPWNLSGQSFIPGELPNRIEWVFGFRMRCHSSLVSYSRRYIRIRALHYLSSLM